MTASQGYGTGDIFPCDDAVEVPPVNPLDCHCLICDVRITEDTGWVRVITRYGEWFECPACVAEQEKDPLPIVTAAGLVA